MKSRSVNTQKYRFFAVAIRLTLAFTLLTTSIGILPQRAQARVDDTSQPVAQGETPVSPPTDPNQNMPPDRMMTPIPLDSTATPDPALAVYPETEPEATFEPPPLPTPSPEEIEEAMARRAIEMKLAEYLHAEGLSHVAVTQVVVDGEWAYGSTKANFEGDSVYILSHQENATWVAALPIIDYQYRFWLDNIPETLISGEEKESIYETSLSPSFREMILNNTVHTSSLESGSNQYTSEPLGIQVKLPNGWTVNEYPNVDMGFSFNSPDLQFDARGEPLTGAYITVETTGRLGGQNSIYEEAHKSAKELVIANNPSIQYELQVSPIHRKLITEVSVDETLYRFILNDNPQNSEQVLVQNQSLLDAILDTLVFIPRSGNLPLKELSIASVAISLAFPFEAGKDWKIVKGYDTGGNHVGKSRYALDLVPEDGDWGNITGALSPEHLEIFHNRVPGEDGNGDGVSDYNYYCEWAKLPGTIQNGRVIVLEICHVILESYLNPDLVSNPSSIKNQVIGSVANVGADPAMGSIRHIHIAAWEAATGSPMVNVTAVPFCYSSDNQNCPGINLRLDGRAFTPGTSHNGEQGLRSSLAPICPVLPGRNLTLNSPDDISSPDDICGPSNSSCIAPNLEFPVYETVFVDHTITFRWQPVTGCTFNGYTFRICPYPNVDYLTSDCFDTGESSTQRSVTINSEWDNQNLYWSVKAANAIGGADWAPSRLLRVEPQSQSCSPPNNAVVLFWDADYECGGHDPVWQTTPGWWNVPDWFNDRASSIRIPSGWSARLYAHANRGQPSKCFSASDSNFSGKTFENSSMGLNDQVSSYEIFNTPNCNASQSGLWHAEYFRHRDLTDRIFEASVTTPYIFFDWGTGGPRSDWPNNDNWSARFTKQVNFSGGDYRFHIQHDDGARVYLDGQLILNAWWDSAFTGHDTTRYVSPGQHEIKLEYYEAGADARIEFWWQGPGALPNKPNSDPNQWRASYMGNKDAKGEPALVLNENSNFINHEWGIGGPGYGLPADRFSSRFERTVNYSCGQYRFNIFADDGVRFWISDNQIINEWHDGVNSYLTDVMELSGDYDLKLEHYENGGASAIRLSWEQIGTCDGSPPTGQITSPADNSATNINSITIQAVASDADAGVDRVEFYAFYNGAWHHLGDDATAPYSFEWGVSAISEQNVRLKIDIVDEAGNKTETAGGEIHVTLDRTTPTGSITTPANGAYLTSDNVPVIATFDDNLSGVQNVHFLVSTCGTGQWTTIGIDTNGADGWGLTWNATGMPDCGVGFHAFAHDKAGNTLSTGIGTTLDRTPPTSFVNNLADTQTTTSFTVSWSGYDLPSGVASYNVQYRDGTGGTWTGWYNGSASSAIFTGVNGHTYYFRCRAIDTAGNVEQYPGGDGDDSTTIQTDSQSPVGSITINNHDEFTSDHLVNLSIQATDNVAVTEMEFYVWNLQIRQWESSGWLPYTTSHEFTLPPGDGWKTIWVWFKDDAGNISDWTTDSIMVDTVPPASKVNDLPPEQSNTQFEMSWRGLDDLYSDWPSDGLNIVYRDVLGWARDVFVQDDYAYVAADDAGLRVVDVSIPSYVREIGQYNTPGLSQGIFVSGTVAYIADGWSGLRIISVADPTAPYELGHFSTPGFAYKVQVVGNYAYLVDAGNLNAGLRAISVTDPSNPVQVDYLATPGEALDLHVIGDFAYIADREVGGLRIVSIADPTNLVEVGYFNTPGYAESVFVSGQVAYVSDWYSLRLISVSDPTNPIEIGYYYPSGIIGKAYVTDTLAYLAVSEHGLQVISIADPSWPTNISHYDTPGSVNNLHLEGGYVSIADERAGLQIVNVSDPEMLTGYGFSIADYNIDYRVDPGGNWISWLSGTPSTTARFVGQDNQRYCFRSHGMDWADNIENPLWDWGVDGQGADTCTTIHAPVIDLDHFVVDDDQTGESFGNNDGQVNPGEFIELRLWLQNNGSGDGNGIYIQPTTSDICVDTSGAYFYDGYVYQGNLPSGTMNSGTDDFDFMVSASCSAGHVIPFNLFIEDTIGNTWQETLLVPVVGSDTIPPGVWYEQVSPKYVLADESTTLSAFILELGSVDWVQADIQSTDSTYSTTIALYDDGNHNDGVAGDRYYANEWVPPVEADFEAVIRAADISGNIGESGVPVHLTSKQFVAQADILLVYDDWDYQWAAGVLPYYTEALEANGLPYDLWDGIYRGAILTDTLDSYRQGVVIWAMPQYGNLGYKPEVQEAIQRYLNCGGKLFITGQDIGYYLTANGTITNTLYEEFLHASFISDDVNLYALNGHPDNPTFAGSYLSITGAGGANNQWWPSEIAPIGQAHAVYTYDTSAIRSVQMSDEPVYTQPELNQAPDGPPRDLGKENSDAQNSSLVDDPVGAIAVDNGIYRVIYFAFGFEAINGQEGDSREEVLEDVINWLLPNRPPRRPDYPYPRPGSEVALQSTVIVPNMQILTDGEPVTDHGVELWWSANDTDPGDSVVFDVYLGQSYVLTESVKVAEGITETHFIPPSLEIGATYYWQVVAWDSDGVPSVGPVWSFSFASGRYDVFLPTILNNTTLRPTAAGYWPLDDGIGTTVSDISGMVSTER